MIERVECGNLAVIRSSAGSRFLACVVPIFVTSFQKNSLMLWCQFGNNNSVERQRLRDDHQCWRRLQPLEDLAGTRWCEDGACDNWGVHFVNMALTAQEVFTETVRYLPLSERLGFAALILQELALPSVTVVNQSDTWSDKDQGDLTAFSLRYAEELYPQVKSLV